MSMADNSGPYNVRELPGVSAPGSETLTVREVAKVLRIGERAAYEAVHEGRIPVLRFGKRFIVPRAALDEYLRSVRPGQA